MARGGARVNRRSFLRRLFASAATIVVAPEAALEALDAVTHKRMRTFSLPPTQGEVDWGGPIECKWYAVGFHVGDKVVGEGMFGRWEALHVRAIEILA
jgi:hypothetical protein